jgi:hypothetical protein
MNQTQQILQHMQKRGSITPMLALKLFGSFRLAARVDDLKRAGHHINSVMVSRGGKRFAAYSLVSGCRKAA